MRRLLIAATFCPLLFVPLGPASVAQAPLLPAVVMQPEPEPDDPIDDRITVVIDAPETADMNTLVRLDASKSRCDSFIWRLPGYTVRTFDSIDRVGFFAPPAPGRYTFVWSAANNASGGKPPSHLLGEQVITVTGATPTPPGPQPPGPPDPFIPPPPPKKTFGLVTFTRDLAARNMTANDKGYLAQFGVNYQQVADGIKARRIGTVPEMDAELKRLNQATAGQYRDRYATLLIGPLGAEQRRLKTEGKLVTMEDHQIVCEEIALGMIEAAK